MTFTEWINTQEDICSKLREQGYEEKNDIRKFFNDRIRCILNTRDIPLKNLSPKRSYERIFQINRDNERKWFFPELFKEDDEEDNTEAIKKVTKTVLAKMKELGMIETEEEYNEAIETVDKGLVFTKGEIADTTDMSYHTAAAIDQVVEEFAELKEVNTKEARRML